MSAAEAPERKEWVKVARSAQGKKVVTVSLVEGNLSAKWSTVAFSTLKSGVREARSYANAMLDELKEALG